MMVPTELVPMCLSPKLEANGRRRRQLDAALDFVGVDPMPAAFYFGKENRA
jgi:hypothetical protein